MSEEAGPNAGIVFDTGNPFAVGEDPVAIELLLVEPLGPLGRPLDERGELELVDRRPGCGWSRRAA